MGRYLLLRYKGNDTVPYAHTPIDTDAVSAHTSTDVVDLSVDMCPCKRCADNAYIDILPQPIIEQRLVEGNVTEG